MLGGQGAPSNFLTGSQPCLQKTEGYTLMSSFRSVWSLGLTCASGLDMKSAFGLNFTTSYTWLSGMHQPWNSWSCKCPPHVHVLFCIFQPTLHLFRAMWLDSNQLGKDQDDASPFPINSSYFWASLPPSCWPWRQRAPKISAFRWRQPMSLNHWRRATWPTLLCDRQKK